MSKRFSFLRQPTWYLGAVLALSGALAVRALVPRLELEHRAVALAVGQGCALLGLLMIAWGVSRRLRSAEPITPPTAQD